LIFCRHGKLFRRGQDARDLELADFSGLRPDPHPPPDWAKEPLAETAGEGYPSGAGSF